MAIHFKKGLGKPLVIFLAAVGLGMFVLGLTLTIIGTLPGYSPYGGNPLKIVGPILLVLGVLIIAGVIVEWCVRTQRDNADKEKGFVVQDYSQPKATFHASSYPRKKKEVHEPPLQTSTPGNNTHSNPSPAFKPHDVLPQSQAKLARPDSREGIPLPNPPLQQQHQGGRQTGNGYQMQKPQAQKNAHFEPIHQAPPTTQPVQYAQVVHAQRQQSSSSANYFFPSVTNQQQQQYGQQQQQQQQQQQYGQQQQTGYINPNDVASNGHLNGNGNGNKTRWGTSKENLDDHLDANSKNEVPVLDIGNAGRDHSTRRSKGKGGQDKGKAGPGDKYGRTGSYRAAHNEREKPTKSPRTQRRGQEGDRTGERYASENPGYTRERAIDVEGPSQSTPKDRDGGSGGYSSHNTSREAAAASNNNFSRRNSSRTRRGSKRKPRGQRREHEHDRDHERSHDRDYDRDRSRDRSRERPRERSSSRGRLGLDDSTTLDYVRGVPIDKDSRRKASSKTANDDDSERQRRHHRDREGDARRNYDSASTSPSDMSHPSDQRSKHKHSTGYNNNAFVDDSRALSPKMSPEDFLNSKEVKDAKNMNFTININAQPGAAVQIALGSQNLPTPKPMITATPMKTDVRTHLSGMSDA